MFSAIFRPKQIFFKPHGGLYRRILGFFSKIYVQNEASALFLQSINIPAEIYYDNRFDRVITIAEAHNKYQLLEAFKDNHKMLIAGSTWAKDEALIKDCIAGSNLANYKYIIAPHNINQAEIDSLVKHIPNAIKWSELNQANAAQAQVLIVDNVGHLSHIYAYADIVYVGGGFNASVHNVLEPAVYGVPVIFGPNHTKSNEALELQEKKAAFAVTDTKSLIKVLIELENEEGKLRLEAGSAAKQYVYMHQGGTKQITEYLFKLL